MPSQASLLSSEPLDRDSPRLEVFDPAAGAVLIFEGTGRDHSEGLSGVIALEYEAQASMAGKIIAAILAETSREVPLPCARSRSGTAWDAWNSENPLSSPPSAHPIATRPTAPHGSSSIASSMRRPSGSGKSCGTERESGAKAAWPIGKKDLKLKIENCSMRRPRSGDKPKALSEAPVFTNINVQFASLNRP